jgi:hypothetical protein
MMLRKQRAPQGDGPNGAQRYASKGNLTRPVPVGQYAAVGLAALIERFPEGQRPELHRWVAGLLALPVVRRR